MQQKIDLEGIRGRLETETGDLGFANRMMDAQYVGWYKQDIPALLSAIDRLTAENEGFRVERAAAQELLNRAKAIMLFHSDRCDVNPMRNYSGSEEHCAVYRAVVRDIQLICGPQK